MFTSLCSYTIEGISLVPVSVEVDTARGLPGIVMIGLCNTAIQESRERIRCAVANSGYHLPPKRFIVNIAPAEIKKSNSIYDLPIALGILSTVGILPEKLPENTFFTGELSLDGKINPVKEIFPLICQAYEDGYRNFFISKEDINSCPYFSDAVFYPSYNFREITDHLTNISQICSKVPNIADSKPITPKTVNSIFKGVIGQNHAINGMIIACAGKHSILLSGPPGVGKTLLATRFSELFPPLDDFQSSEVTRIHSIAGNLKTPSMIRKIPFRNPHHSISPAGLSGGGKIPSPGEVSLAHHGILFLDEIAEFSKHALETLREPLSSGEITISRSLKSITFPARFILISAMNPCPCGYYGDRHILCHCSESEIKHYHKKISGPLLDRFDLRIPLSRPEPSCTDEFVSQLTTDDIKNCYKIQLERQNKFNSDLTAEEIPKYINIDLKTKSILNKATQNLNISMRGYHKILKISQTICDLKGNSQITAEDIYECLGYRCDKF